MESHKRSVAKAITFRVIATLATMAAVYLLTGSLALTNTIGAIDLVSKLILYYAHERVWEKVNWGKGNR